MSNTLIQEQGVKETRLYVDTHPHRPHDELETGTATKIIIEWVLFAGFGYPNVRRSLEIR
jgi:hypothetical protein